MGRTTKSYLAYSLARGVVSKATMGGLRAEKVWRIRSVTWEPPYITFDIERHGAIVEGGSGYAEIQTWRVDVERETAHITATRKRRVRPMNEKLDTEALATELTDLILAGVEDQRLRWSGGRVQIRMAEVLPPAPKRTTEGRRKRLNDSLGILLGSHGWTWNPGGWWQPGDVKLAEELEG